jgi:hypothetical protein
VAVLRIQWVDPKLAFSPDDCQCKTQVFPDDDFGDFAAANELLWPTFTLFNQQGNRWTQNKRVVVQPNGQATYFERFSTTFQFFAQRHLVFYTIRIFVPLLLIIIVAWITFFMQGYTKRVEITTANRSSLSLSILPLGMICLAWDTSRT